MSDDHSVTDLPRPLPTALRRNVERDAHRTPVDFAALERELRPAPKPRSEPQKVSDLANLAGWINTISFLDLLELAKSIADSEADASMPADVRLAKSLATWARATIRATSADSE